MSIFTINRDIITVSSDISGATTSKVLPTNTYKVSFNPKIGFYLEIDPTTAKTPEKIYGDAQEVSSMVLSRFIHEGKSMGAMFLGDKGSGKSLTVSLIRQKALAADIPVVLIESPFYDQNFKDFIRSLGQVVVIYDEFEKVYDKEYQDQLLSLFDGVANSNILSLVVANNVRAVSEFMFQRPGRFLYRFDYTKIPSTVIREVAKDNDIEERHIESLIKLVNTTAVFSFDILMAIIKELRFYPLKDFDDVVAPLNIRHAYASKRYWLEIVAAYDKNKKSVDLQLLDSKTFSVRCINDFTINFDWHDKEENYFDVYLSEYNIVSYNQDKGLMMAETEGFTFTLKVNQTESAYTF